MKNKSKTKIFILSLGLIFAFLIINNYNFFNEQDEIIEIRDKTNLKSPKNSGTYIESFIHIDGNWSETANTYDWCTGGGSWGNPYIIENVIINTSSSPTGSGIYIENSIYEYFIIKNVTVYNAGVNFDDAGIKLENTNNGALLNNNCSNNVGNGILLINYCENNIISENIANNNGENGILLMRCENNIISKNIANNNDDGIFLWIDCINNTISGNIANNNLDGIRLYPNCNNNTISGNTANDNSQSGIDINDCDNNIISGNYLSNEATLNQDSGIRMSSNCKNNIITRNNIKNNQYFGIYIYDLTCQDNIIYLNSLIGTGDWHARDEGTNNQWYSSGIGNYWDNHTSPDSDNDGIVDVPYTWITGSANSEDIFPLVENPLHHGEKIHIDDSSISAWNWSKTAKLKIWCIGSGTNFDPYVIDGLEIDAGGSGSGIFINNSKNEYFIIKNVTVYTAGSTTNDAGIKLENTNNGTLINNNCSNSGGNGILLRNYCENNTISGNTANNNGYYGIYLRWYCDNNTISGNTASNIGTSNQNVGIYLYFYCDNNTISGNIANGNYSGYGIYLRYYCDDNTISGNTANNNGWNGIYLYDYCDDNIILGNTANNNSNSGIVLNLYCDHNTISGNIANGNIWGIFVYNFCDNNTISGNTANNNAKHGIYLLYYCDDYIILGNTANDNEYGIYVDNHCGDNNIVENYLYFNTNGAINIETADCNGNTIKKNILLSNEGEFISNNGTNTFISLNYFGISPPSFIIEVLDQSFSNTGFIITFNISSETGFGPWEQSIQIWWSGIGVSLLNIAELGNGLYDVSLTPIFVVPGQDPILLNMTISAAHHIDKYFETYIAVEPPEIAKLLQVEITEHSYSLEHFNLTIFVCNETELGIDSAIIQIWWNGVDVSNDVINLGNGFYFVSLEPITVAPGEDPILLNGIISADGYQDKSFETYIAVDPDTLDKEIGESAEEFPLTIIIIASTSIAGGIGVAGITLFLLRKRKRASEVK